MNGSDQPPLTGIDKVNKPIQILGVYGAVYMEGGRS